MVIGFAQCIGARGVVSRLFLCRGLLCCPKASGLAAPIRRRWRPGAFPECVDWFCCCRREVRGRRGDHLLGPPALGGIRKRSWVACNKSRRATSRSLDCGSVAHAAAVWSNRVSTCPAAERMSRGTHVIVLNRPAVERMCSACAGGTSVHCSGLTCRLHAPRLPMALTPAHRHSTHMHRSCGR